MFVRGGCSGCEDSRGFTGKMFKAARGFVGRYSSRLGVSAAVEFVLVVEEGVHKLAEWIVRGGSFGCEGKRREPGVTLTSYVRVSSSASSG